ncbi:hypothetical protein M9Y10_041415 [Tritrichomonas musculus]|uniref:Uncharacterized protein n=1 Tax=Tritrichomonas musculus TaxID=1915356 RepID=A0ABR2K4A1_9EUKA
MLPKGDEAENMEQSTLNNVFNLFGKGITQMLQQSVNQQTVIDELRAQNRSLQTQIANLTASLDEVEDRIFVRLQNMQPTIYTREGVPFDDALDSISSKVRSLNEKITSNTEALSKIDAELTAKVDREEFVTANNEKQKVEESFGGLSNSIQAIQKDMKQVKQDIQDSNERMIQTIKFQIQSQMLHQQMSTEDQDLTDYVTKDELREKLNKLKIDIANASSGDQGDASAIVDFAISGKGLTEEKVKEAYALLQQRKANIDKNYAKQKKDVNQEMSRLMRLAKNVSRTNPQDFNGEEEEEEKIENENDQKEGNKDSQQKIEYRTVGVDTVKDIFEEENTESRPPNPRKKKKSVGITVKPPKNRNKNKNNTNNDNDEDEDEDENEDEESEEEQVNERKKKSKQKEEKGLDSLIDKMQEEQDQNLQTSEQQQIVSHVDEGKIAQKVIEAIMPRVENMLVESLSSTNGNGIKLEKNEAKQLINQLSLLDSLSNEMKSLRVKINMKFDKTRAETELDARITKDEFFSYLYQLFPDNELLRGMAPHSKSKLPPLKNARASSSMTNQANQSVTNSNTNANTNTNLHSKANANTANVNSIANSNSNVASNAYASSSNSHTTSNARASSNMHTTPNSHAISGSYSNTNTRSSMNAGAKSSMSANANTNVNLNTSVPSNVSMNSNSGMSSTMNSNYNNSSSNSKSGLSDSQGAIYTKNSKSNYKGKMTMKPTRNSNMVSLNQKFLKGADGHYYLRDMGSDSNEITASMFGTDKTDDVDINAAFDFQPFRRVDESANVVKNIREDTPNDVE